MKIISKALTVASAGSSLSGYLPTPLTNQVIDFIREINIMRQHIRTFRMTTRQITKPKLLGGATAYYIPDGKTATQSEYDTDQVTWIAKKLMSFVPIDEEAIEDSQPDVVNELLFSMAQAIAESEERALLTGDTTHTATAPTPESATSANWYKRDDRLMFNGLFTVAAGANAATPVSAGGGVIDEDYFNQALYRLGKYGRVKANLRAITGSIQASNMRSLPVFKDVSASGLVKANFVEGMRTAGETPSGLITTVYGVPVFEAPNAPDDEVAIFHNGSCEIGDRRLIRMRSANVIESEQTKYVVSSRLAFEFNYEDATTVISGLSTSLRSVS